MPNCYTTVDDLKVDLTIASTITASDALLLRLIESVSRGIDDQTGRIFYHQTQTNVYDGNSLRQFWLPTDRTPADDLLSITTLKVDEDGDMTYEKTLTTTVPDYWLWPDNATPKLRIDLNPYSSALSAFPTGRRRIQIVGVFGYSNETEAAGTLGAAISDTTGTSVTMTAGHTVKIGHTIIVDSEQLFVSNVTVNALTVVRGVNSTTAATHSNGAAVTARRYPRPIERAAILLASRIWREAQTGYSGSVGGAEFGTYNVQALYPAIRDLISPYVVKGVA